MSPSRHRHSAAGRPSPAASRFFRFARTFDGSYRLDPSQVPAGVDLLGEGQIGGKARGLVFVMRHVEDGARLTEHADLVRFPHSALLPTDAFDDFMKENDLAGAVEATCDGRMPREELAARFAAATFPAAWRERLIPVLRRERRPIVARSSSIMEDDPDHSFAGMYLSEFLPNQGSIESRLARLVASIQRIYASTFGPNARAYRKRHNLDWRNEKMAILIQNMIGSRHSADLFYPLVGGVAFSRNFYPWTDRLRPEDGVVRLVVGIGTRAVGREYARVFSPRLPGLRPEGSDPSSIVRYSQETVDVLDMAEGRLSQRRLNELSNPLLSSICSVVHPDGSVSDPVSAQAMLSRDQRFVATFTRLIEQTTLMPFTPLVRDLLASLGDLLDYPVDVEFALDFSSEEAARSQSPLLYILQVRPLGSRSEHRWIRAPEDPGTKVLLRSHRVLGNGTLRRVRHLVFVDPTSYDVSQACAIARSVGRINDALIARDESYILVGPGRWASSNPRLGVPVEYSEISGASVIVEMATESFAPELSYGTHFYADMVSSGVLYIPLALERGDVLSNEVLHSLHVVERGPHLTHYEVPTGLDVYVDGRRQQGLIVVSPMPRARTPR
ncbi:MAG: PEP/pyruvate-binding domain-containing protein [Candidatus Bipolaricaulia bacterium]